MQALSAVTVAGPGFKNSAASKIWYKLGLPALECDLKKKKGK